MPVPMAKQRIVSEYGFFDEGQTITRKVPQATVNAWYAAGLVGLKLTDEEVRQGRKIEDFLPKRQTVLKSTEQLPAALPTDIDELPPLEPLPPYEDPEVQDPNEFMKQPEDEVAAGMPQTLDSPMTPLDNEMQPVVPAVDENLPPVEETEALPEMAAPTPPTLPPPPPRGGPARKTGTK